MREGAFLTEVLELFCDRECGVHDVGFRVPLRMTKEELTTRNCDALYHNSFACVYPP